MANKKFFYALATLIGMIIGVGIFAIPYVCAQAGFSIGLFYLIVIGGVILFIHLFYGEIALRTTKDHGLVCYAERFFGLVGKRIVGAIIIFEFYGALLAYLIVGGNFLSLIFKPILGGSDFLWVLVFFVFGALIILFGLKTIGPAEFFMSLFLLFVAGVFIFRGAPLINPINLSGINWVKFFLPYGVILFALTGGAAIPEMRQILKGQERKLRTAIIWGTLIPVLICILFALSVTGITGNATTEDAISGLAPYFGQKIIILGAIFGFLAVMTSFIVVGANLRRIFYRDYHLNNILAWALVCFVPLLGYLFGINNFIVIIGLVGAIAGGMEGVATILIWRRSKRRGDREPEYNLKIFKPVFYLLILMFILGIIYQLIYLAK
ncbi:MAG: hypothetical protein HY764_03760 [Candidatus Portnoybacteria bacterium]|nr:hypothetical protein [Candidatus Portnoybacteria bacterium]